MRTNLKFISPLSLVAFVAGLMLLSACGSKMERASKLATGGGNTAQANNIVRIPTCSVVEVLAQDGQMITLRTTFKGSNAKALSLEFNGDGRQIDLTNSNYAANQCATPSQDSQILVATVPYASTELPSRVKLNLEQKPGTPIEAAVVSCAGGVTGQVKNSDPFSSAPAANVCEAAGNPNGALNDGMVTMSSSQIGRYAKFTVSTSELNPSLNAAYAAVIDFGDGTRAPMIVRPSSSVATVSTIDRTYLDINDLNANLSGQHMVRVAMFNRNGVRTVVQKTVAHGTYSQMALPPQYLVENPNGGLDSKSVAFSPPKPVTPTNLVAIGYGSEDGSSGSSGGNIMVYRLPSNSSSQLQRVLTIPNPFVNPAVPTIQQKTGVRVALGDIDGTGNMSLVMTQEDDRYMSIYNEASPGRLRTPVNMNDTLKNVGDFSLGSNVAIAMDAQGPQILFTNRSKNVSAMKFDPNNGSLVSTTPGNAAPWDKDGILGEVRVASLGKAVVYTQSSRKDKLKLFRNGMNNALTGNDTMGNDAWASIGYNSRAGLDMFVATGKGDKGEVNVYASGVTNAVSLKAFNRAKGGVKTAMADVNGDGISEILVAQGRDVLSGADASNQIAVLDGKSAIEGNAQILYVFTPYQGFRGGLYVGANLPYRGD